MQVLGARPGWRFSRTPHEFWDTGAALACPEGVGPGVSVGRPRGERKYTWCLDIGPCVRCCWPLRDTGLSYRRLHKNPRTIALHEARISAPRPELQNRMSMHMNAYL